MPQGVFISCLNCGTRFTGKYCNECGQKATVTKLNWKSLLEEAAHFITHVEHSFIYTSKKLFSAPGPLVKEYLDGRRKKVHKPITFLLIWLAIVKLVGFFLNYLTQYFNLYQFEKAAPVLRVVWNRPINEGVAKYESLIIILIEAPVLMLIGWVIFRKTKTSIVENWVAILYALSLGAMVSTALIVFSFVLRLFNTPLTTGFINDLYFIVYFLVSVWVIFSFEKTYRPQLSAIKQLLIAIVVAIFAGYAADIIEFGIKKFVPL